MKDVAHLGASCRTHGNLASTEHIIKNRDRPIQTVLVRALVLTFIVFGQRTATVASVENSTTQSARVSDDGTAKSVTIPLHKQRPVSPAPPTIAFARARDIPQHDRAVKQKTEDKEYEKQTYTYIYSGFAHMGM